MADEKVDEKSVSQDESHDKVEEEVKAPEAPEDKEEKVDPSTKPQDDSTTESKEVSGKFKDIIKQIEELSVLELSELVKELEDRFGVSAAAPMAVMGAPVVAGEAEAVEEKTSFDVVLAAAGDKKIQVIKAVREVKPELGLKEAKDLVDGAPKELLKGAKKDEANEAKAKLEAAGATVELK